MKKLLSIITILLISCSGPHQNKNFFSKKTQEITHRIVKGNLTVVDSLKLSKLKIYLPGSLRLDKNHIFIDGINSMRIAVIDKRNLGNRYFITIHKGRGPKELLRINDFDVRDSLLVAIGGRQRKIMIWRLPDTFVKAAIIRNHNISTGRIQIVNPYNFLIFSSRHYLVDVLNNNGVRLNGFINLPANHSPFKYQGEMELHDNHIYYAGFSEPVLKRYSVKGKLSYSVSTIDNYDTEGNYMTTQGGNLVMGYAPGALFSTLDFDINNNYWLVKPSSNGDSTFTYLDVYNVKNGKYIASFSLNHRGDDIKADHRNIYFIATIKGEYYLMIYKNDIEQRLK